MKKSPAIDAGDNPLLQAFDQRGPDFFRTIGPQTDIGAYERQDRRKKDHHHDHHHDDSDHHDKDFIEEDIFIPPPIPVPPPPPFLPYGPFDAQAAVAPVAAAAAPVAVATPAIATTAGEISDFIATNEAPQVLVRPLDDKEEQEVIAHQPAREQKTIPSSGCSLVGGPGQEANNFGMMFMAFLAYCKMVWRRKAVNK